MADYDHRNIEGKWQAFWAEKKVYSTSLDTSKPKSYILDMFPYPSGSGLHVGHPRGYIGSDVLARMRRMQGFNVLHPMGFDAFGLPAEQYAIKTGQHPALTTETAIRTFKQQLDLIGLSYDWDREIRTMDPEFYRWTQWIFLQLFDSYFDEGEKKAKPIAELIARFEREDASWKGKSEEEKQEILMNHRLAYVGYGEVNWCPELGTVLANDEIITGEDGRQVSERGGHPVEKRQMRQWFLRISAYADRLLSGLEGIDWPNHIKEIQKNWIGKSEGAEIVFLVKDSDKTIKVFTTRPETLFGVTYIAVAGKENLFTGKYAINPANGEEVPIWEAEYVMEGYGTGAVMGVPAHDERDRAFAEKHDLVVRQVIDDNGKTMNSGEFDGLSSEEAKRKITEFAGGEMVTTYRMRDAIFARQRYWGEPIPIVHKGGLVAALPESQLPLVLPEVSSFAPTGEGASPLASVSHWAAAGYETDTMPGWAGSSWYFLRFMDPKNHESFAGKEALSYWQDVDVYVGGAEHATGHLLYARFWHKFLHDRGYVPTDEPFRELRNQGMILAEDGRKMSKRWGNIVNPDDMVARFGADSFRLYEMFIAPFDQYTPWSTDGLVGTRRFLERVWRIKDAIGDADKQDIDILTHKTIKKVTDHIEDFRFNTAVSAMMILANAMDAADSVPRDNYLDFLKLLAPFAPHMAEEIWHQLGEEGSIHGAPWPKADEAKLQDEEVTIAIQVNGKVRDTLSLSKDAPESEAYDLALDRPIVQDFVREQKIKKFIYIPGKIINIVL